MHKRSSRNNRAEGYCRIQGQGGSRNCCRRTPRQEDASGAPERTSHSGGRLHWAGPNSSVGRIRLRRVEDSTADRNARQSLPGRGQIPHQNRPRASTSRRSGHDHTRSPLTGIRKRESLANGSRAGLQSIIRPGTPVKKVGCWRHQRDRVFQDNSRDSSSPDVG